MTMASGIWNRQPTRAEMRLIESEDRLYAVNEIARLQSENEALKAANRDLQDWFDDARAAAEQAQARVAELDSEAEWLIATNSKITKAKILRKQAEAVEAAAKDLERLMTEVEPEDSDTALSIQIAWGAVLNEAQRLRQQANEQEQK